MNSREGGSERDGHEGETSDGRGHASMCRVRRCASVQARAPCRACCEPAGPFRPVVGNGALPLTRTLRVCGCARTAGPRWRSRSARLRSAPSFAPSASELSAPAKKSASGSRPAAGPAAHASAPFSWRVGACQGTALVCTTEPGVTGI